MKREQEKKCFIVTPIGNESDPIRRHIEGIIEAAIRPALGDKYELIVAHKIFEPGSITKQIISEIYNAELVIANLTNRNPNVMYELAFRHSLGKPVIMIAESGTSLPADIIMERTIFYQNDAQGTLELKKAIAKAESEIDFSKIGSPIYDVLHNIDRDKSIIQLSQNDTQTGQEVLPYILDKLNKLEDVILANRSFTNTISPRSREWKFQCSLSNIPEEMEDIEFHRKISHPIYAIPEIDVHRTWSNYANKEFAAYFSAPAELSPRKLKSLLIQALSDAGFENIVNPILTSDKE